MSESQRKKKPDGTKPSRMQKSGLRNWSYLFPCFKNEKMQVTRGQATQQRKAKSEKRQTLGCRVVTHFDSRLLLFVAMALSSWNNAAAQDICKEENVSLSRLIAIGTLAACSLTLNGQTYTGRIGAGSSPPVKSQAGGTVVVGVALSDGLILATDSQLTVSFEKPSPSYKIMSDYAPKLFEVGHVAVATYGEAFVSGRSIASYLTEFEAGRKGKTFTDVDDVAKQFSGFFASYYDKEGKNLAVGFIFAGYDDHGKGKLLEIAFPQSRDAKILHSTDTDQGAIWRGQTDVIFRLIKGYDPGIENLPKIATLSDDDKKQLAKDLEKLEYAILFQYMMLQDGIDFALSLVQATVDMQRFSFGTSGSLGAIPGVGGSVDVIAVTPSGVTWVRRKSLFAK